MGRFAGLGAEGVAGNSDSMLSACETVRACKRGLRSDFRIQMSFPRRRESRPFDEKHWVPASAGTTKLFSLAARRIQVLAQHLGAIQHTRTGTAH
jgi:hypothetical protein